MTTTPEQIEAVALAMSRVDWCGAKFNGEFCLCDDPRLDDDVRSPECFCRLQAPAAINAMRPFIRAEALEEAAKVAEGPVKRRSLVTGEVIYRGDDEHDYAVDGSSDYGAGRIEAAADIRALKEKNDA
jgi:hypothetical protein